MSDPNQELTEALDIIADLVLYHCSVGGGLCDSVGVSANADAMRFLAAHGRFKIELAPTSRWVTGRFIRPEKKQ